MNKPGDIVYTIDQCGPKVARALVVSVSAKRLVLGSLTPGRNYPEYPFRRQYNAGTRPLSTFPTTEREAWERHLSSLLVKEENLRVELDRLRGLVFDVRKRLEAL